MAKKEHTIMVANQAAVEKLSALTKHWNLFRKFTIVKHYPAYAGSSHIAVVVKGRKKEIHAFRALAYMSYHPY